jgi:ketosteroid isomerase-like protein
VRRLHEELFAAVPDIQDEVLEYYVEGSRVAVRFVSRSRLPGRAFEMEIADFFEVRNGLVVSDRTIFNAGQKCRPLSALGVK